MLLTMEDSQDVEVEIYEEIIDDVGYVSPGAGLPYSSEEVSGPSPSQDPMEFPDNTVISFTLTSRPALRPELVDPVVDRWSQSKICQVKSIEKTWTSRSSRSSRVDSSSSRIDRLADD